MKYEIWNKKKVKPCFLGVGLSQLHRSEAARVRYASSASSASSASLALRQQRYFCLYARSNYEIRNKVNTSLNYYTTNNLKYEGLNSEFEKNLSLAFLDSIKKIFNNLNNYDDERDLLEKKYEIQKYIENEWINIVKNNLDVNKNLQSNFNKIIKHVNESVKLLNYKRKAKRIIPLIIDDIENIDYVLISYSIIINYYNKMGYTALAHLIGKNILFLYFNKFIKDNTIDWDNFQKINNINEQRIIYLGDFFLTSFIFSEFIYRDYNPKESEIALVKINPKYLDLIKNNLVVSPSSLPMISQPAIWDTNKYGGFLINEKIKDKVFHKSPNTNHKMENKKNIYRAINYLNSIQFEINNDLLNFLLNEGNILLDIKKDKDNTELLQNIITIKIAETYKNLPFYLNTFADWRGRIYTNCFFITYQGSDLSAGLLLLHEGEKLTTDGIDYLYIYGANLYNETINEISVAKLSFGERINWVEKNYNKIINLDIEFIKKAESPILFAAFCLTVKNFHNDKNYLVKLPVFLDATCSGIQHLSALMKDHVGAGKVNLTPQTELDPVQDIYIEIKDAINKSINELGITNPALSHFKNIKFTRSILKTSIMTKVYNVTRHGITEQLVNKLNKLEPGDENYDLIKSSLEGEGETNEELINKNYELRSCFAINKKNINDFDNNDENEINEINENNQYIDINIVNKDSKKSISTNKKLKKKGYPIFEIPGIINPVYVTYAQLFEISRIIDTKIFELYPPLGRIYEYFTKISKLMLSLEVPLTWFTPIGLKLTQQYLKTKINKVSVKMGATSRTLALKTSIEETDNRKQVQAIIPNIIHSLDASHLIKIIITSIENNKVVKKEDQIKYIIPIHDCFGTLPNSFANLDLLVKQEFIKLYTDENFLEKFHEKLLKNVKDNQLEITSIENRDYILLSDQKTKYALPPLIKLKKTTNNQKINTILRKKLNIINKDDKILIKIPELPEEGTLIIEDIIKSKHMIT